MNSSNGTTWSSPVVTTTTIPMPLDQDVTEVDTGQPSTYVDRYIIYGVIGAFLVIFLSLVAITAAVHTIKKRCVVQLQADHEAMGALSIATIAPLAVPLLLWSMQRASCMSIGEPTPPSAAVGQHGGALGRHSQDSAPLRLQGVEVVTGSYEADQRHPPEMMATNTTTLALPRPAKSVNPFLLVALVVSALLVLLLGFAYVTRKTDPGDSEDAPRQPRDGSAASRHNGAFEQDPEGGTDGSGYPSQPPSYEDVIKVPWTIWAATQQGAFTQGTGATPPPSYEDARRTFPFPE
ncbi:uncharacterized protein LOC144111450 isoform X2 [Amblyomma americanum]